MRTCVTYHLVSMLTLGVDTSESLGGVALYDEGRLSQTRMMDTPLSHAESLFPLIEELMEASSVDKSQVDLVSINRGPGSFTGLRIGLAAMKGLCQSLEIPLVGVDGTLVYRRFVEERQRVCVVLSSRRDLYYVRWFGGSRPKGPTAVMREAELIARLGQEERELWLVGSGAPRLEVRLRSLEHVRIAPEAFNQPSPLAVAQWGSKNFVADQLYSVEPLYVEPLLIGGKAA
ncbi:tRNA (adenosine(37)-N6)-threonylcarbamoyltransferase complex dimerization subunit type 1 TsaB [Candidatus Bipolaricaulota bacterium]|nr:tRNA (adenosine(37)-N6)-threonylcarbamoyltransferase complex dimerization subunit type 1 TsaB [Candidatus Bipolaricaulota bacterium]TFH11839.1 MAG: tRNA (adenosine(37)-N6)-threonylcarbamoyltransferase complex dimerization subunit type 1 TsaB [Candidatus Atribacteria bacterium]